MIVFGLILFVLGGFLVLSDILNSFFVLSLIIMNMQISR